jgi:hypothetical protein
MTLNTQKWQLWPKHMLANVGKTGIVDLGDASDSDVSVHVPRLSRAIVSIGSHWQFNFSMVWHGANFQPSQI